VEVLVDAVLPLALQGTVTKSEIRALLQPVRKDESGRLNFTQLQDIVLASQRSRLMAIMKSYGLYGKKERGPKLPYQCKQADALLAITRKKKMNVPEENHAQEKRLHAYSTHLALLRDCKDQADQINLNVSLCRHRGDVNDRWDRYSAVRRTGRSGYVKARNHPRLNPAMDDGLADRHPGVSCLASTMC
jgi:hypothetical protein